MTAADESSVAATAVTARHGLSMLGVHARLTTAPALLPTREKTDKPNKESNLRRGFLRAKLTVIYSVYSPGFDSGP